LEFQGGDIGIRGLDSPFFFDGEIFRKISERIIGICSCDSFTIGRKNASNNLLIVPEEANFSIEINTIVPEVGAVKTEEHIILPPMLKVCWR
jgi:hypothetical protein